MDKHKLLVDFIRYCDYRLPVLINNVELLRETFPRDISNKITFMLLTGHSNDILDTTVLEVVQVWKILDSELKKLKQTKLNDVNKEYSDLERIRNKIIGHRMENDIKKQMRWFRSKYGYLGTLKLAARVAKRIRDRIENLIENGLIEANEPSKYMPPKFTKAEVKNYFEVLKKNNLT